MQYPANFGYPSPPPPRRRLPLSAVVVVGVLVGAAVLGGGWLIGKKLLDDGDADAGNPVAGQLRGTFPEKPTVGWQLDADTLFPGAQFVRPDPTSSRYEGAGFIDLDDTLITTAILPSTDRRSELVAIDSKTGRVRWSNDNVGFQPVCATATVNGLLPCVDEPDREAHLQALSFVRMSDGSIDHRETVQGVSQVEVHDGDVFLLGYRSMSRGSVSNPTATWQQTYQPSDSQGCPGSGDTTYFDVTDSVAYYGSDIGVVVADVDDGHRLHPEEIQNVQVYPGQGFTGRLCTGTDFDTVTTAIVDEQGDVLRTHDARAQAAEPWLVAPRADQPYIIERTAYDFATGEKLWTASGAPEVDRLHTIVGDVVLGGGRYQEAPLAAFDIATGENLWSSQQTGPIAMSDGKRVIVRGDDDGLTSINLATGGLEWTLPGAEPYSEAPAGSGFAITTRDQITFYPPTGGPAVAPGRGAAPDEDESDQPGPGGPITKCGKVPEMRPVEYRAEGGALIVKMEIKATCPGGDIVSTDRMRVTIRDDVSVICSGVFDFSKDPLVLGGSGSEATVVELTFGSDAIWRHPSTLGGSTSSSGPGEVVTTAKAAGNELVDCEDEGTSTGPTSTSNAPQPSNNPWKTSGTGMADCGGDAEALNALRAQVDTDRPVVQSTLADRWLAQLSAKNPGLVAPDVDGTVITWTPCEILRQHLRLRLQYPEVRLVWSDEWRTFDLQGWWVTIAGVTFEDANAANAWCDQRAIPVDECFAKLVSNNRDSTGTVQYRR